MGNGETGNGPKRAAILNGNNLVLPLGGASILVVGLLNLFFLVSDVRVSDAERETKQEGEIARLRQDLEALEKKIDKDVKTEIRLLQNSQQKIKIALTAAGQLQMEN